MKPLLYQLYRYFPRKYCFPRSMFKACLMCSTKSLPSRAAPFRQATLQYAPATMASHSLATAVACATHAHSWRVVIRTPPAHRRTVHIFNMSVRHRTYHYTLLMARVATRPPPGDCDAHKRAPPTGGRGDCAGRHMCTAVQATAQANYRQAAATGRPAIQHWHNMTWVCN